MGTQAYFCLKSSHLTLTHDWCHVRRKFLNAEKTHPAESLFFVNQIRLLFKIEEKIAPLSLEEKKIIRIQESKLITERIHQKCLEMENVLPQSPLAKAINSHPVKLHDI
jgi:hypothetical protein